MPLQLERHIHGVDEHHKGHQPYERGVTFVPRRKTNRNADRKNQRQVYQHRDR
ncbi:hypothetical protein D3C87_2189690 [compost metagenome]